MTGWQMYWLLRLDGIKDMFQGLAAICTTVGVIGLAASVIFKFIYIMDKEDDGVLEVANYLRKPIFVLFVVSGIALLGQMLLPSTKQMAAIIVVPKIVNNKQAQEMPENLIELCNEWTKDKIKELKGETK